MNDSQSKNHGSVSIRITTKQQQQRKCYFCGENIYPEGRNQCAAKDQICNNCGKAGHFKCVCKSISKTILASAHQERSKIKINEFYSQLLLMLHFV